MNSTAALTLDVLGVAEVEPDVHLGGQHGLGDREGGAAEAVVAREVVVVVDGEDHLVALGVCGGEGERLVPARAQTPADLAGALVVTGVLTAGDAHLAVRVRTPEKIGVAQVAGLHHSHGDAVWCCRCCC